MFDDFELNAERIPTYKLIAHVVQIVLSFVAWCLEIAVWHAKHSSVNGQSGWAFAVCFLSAPAWIYLIGCPRFPRTRRLAQPHAMVAVDVFFTILWLSAFAAQAAYNSGDRCGDACGISKAIVAMGVFITVLFGVTSFLSIVSLKYYQFHGRLPGYDRLDSKKAGRSGQNIDPDMAAFSTAPHDEEPYARINDMDGDYDHDHAGHDLHDYHSTVADATSTAYMGASSVAGNSSSAYGNAGSHLPSQQQHLASTVGHNPFDDHASDLSTSIHPAATDISAGSTTGHSFYVPPTVHDEFEGDRPVRFPDANYDRT